MKTEVFTGTQTTNRKKGTKIMEEKNKKSILSRFSYNAPVILTFTLIAVAVQLITMLPFGRGFHEIFVARPRHLTNPLLYIGLVSHPLGHSGWSHLIGNFTMILLVGPMLEEKYGSKRLLFMMFVTAFVTGIVNVLFFRAAVCGASGIVFMLILLASCTNSGAKEGKIPITLILACAFYLGREILNSLRIDNISQLSHIIGGLFGAFFGLYFAKKLKREESLNSGSFWNS